MKAIELLNDFDEFELWQEGLTVFCKVKNGDISAWVYNLAGDIESAILGAYNGFMHQLSEYVDDIFDAGIEDHEWEFSTPRDKAVQE